MNTTKKYLVAVIAMLFCSSSFAGDKEGNGGGGVVKNGNYMSFYSAGLYVEPSSGSTPTEVPGLDSILDFITGISYVSDYTKAPILDALSPSDSRHYYIASPGQLTPEIRGRLLKEFTRVTGVDAGNLTLYALTDTSTDTTFLLPDYFKLKTNDQMAILFHEAYWIRHPHTTYNEVVKAEMAFEAALVNPNDAARVFDFVQYIGSNDEIYNAELKWDISTYALGGLVKHNDRGYYLTLRDLYGPEFFQCEQRINGDNYNLLWGNAGNMYDAAGVKINDFVCDRYVRINIGKLLKKYTLSSIMRWYSSALNIFSHEFFALTVKVDGKAINWCTDDIKCNELKNSYYHSEPFITVDPLSLQDLADCQLDLSNMRQNIYCEQKNKTLVFWQKMNND